MISVILLYLTTSFTELSIFVYVDHLNPEIYRGYVQRNITSKRYMMDDRNKLLVN